MPSGTYATLTLTTLVNALAERLSDPQAVRWTSDELAGHLREALRVWNALTAHFRGTGTFNSTLGQPFYDLPTQMPALRGQTLTANDLVSTLEYDLMEPQSTGSAWAGSSQFSLDDLTGAISRRRDQFLRETSAVLTRQQLPIAPPPDGRIPLPESIIAIRRGAWVSLDGVVTPLIRDDEWGFNAYRNGWVQQPGRPPRAFSVASTQPLYVQMAPPPLDTGVLDLLTVNRGADVTTTSLDTPASLGIPNDWAWVVLFGALADLLSRDGLALDPTRAAYAQQRWEQGIALATTAPVVLTGRVNNVPLAIGSLADADKYSPTWQTIPADPRRVLTAGHTLAGFWPAPGVPVQGGSYSLTLDVVRNAPVPATLADYVQIGPELADTMLDYAQHRALFKEGSSQLTQSIALLNRFLSAAGVATMKQSAEQPNRGAALQQTVQDLRVVAAESPAESAST